MRLPGKIALTLTISSCEFQHCGPSCLCLICCSSTAPHPLQVPPDPVPMSHSHHQRSMAGVRSQIPPAPNPCRVLSNPSQAEPALSFRLRLSSSSLFWASTCHWILSLPLCLVTALVRALWSTVHGPHVFNEQMTHVCVCVCASE